MFDPTDSLLAIGRLYFLPQERYWLQTTMKFHNHSFNDNLSDIIITVTAFEIETMLQTSDISYSEWQVDKVYC